MSKQVRLRRGTTAQHSSFTGAQGEVTVDTDKKVVVVHDGSTAGGVPMFPSTGGTMTDNLAFANGKGIDFSATPGTGTSELLDDYEEGTWTPSDASGASLAFTVTSARYTKIGRVVFAHFYLEYPTNASASVAVIGGLPFTSASNMFSPSVSSTNQGMQMGLRTTQSSTNISVMNLATNTDYSNTVLSGKFLIGMITYFV